MKTNRTKCKTHQKIHPVLQAASVPPSPSLHTPARQSLDPSPLLHEQICRTPTLVVWMFCYRLPSLRRQRTTKIKKATHLCKQGDTILVIYQFFQTCSIGSRQSHSESQQIILRLPITGSYSL